MFQSIASYSSSVPVINRRSALDHRCHEKLLSYHPSAWRLLALVVKRSKRAYRKCCCSAKVVALSRHVSMSFLYSYTPSLLFQHWPFLLLHAPPPSTTPLGCLMLVHFNWVCLLENSTEPIEIKSWSWSGLKPIHPRLKTYRCKLDRIRLGLERADMFWASSQWLPSFLWLGNLIMVLS